MACSTSVGFEGVANLLHEILALENVKGFLFSLPVVSTHYHERLSGSSRHLDRLMSVNDLFYNAFQVVSKFVNTDCVHKNTFAYGSAVQVCTESRSEAQHSGGFPVAAL